MQFSFGSNVVVASSDDDGGDVLFPWNPTDCAGGLVEAKPLKATVHLRQDERFIPYLLKLILHAFIVQEPKGTVLTYEYFSTSTIVSIDVKVQFWYCVSISWPYPTHLGPDLLAGSIPAAAHY